MTQHDLDVLSRILDWSKDPAAYRSRGDRKPLAEAIDWLTCKHGISIVAYWREDGHPGWQAAHFDPSGRFLKSEPIDFIGWMDEAVAYFCKQILDLVPA